jgi:hypothetical protein
MNTDTNHPNRPRGAKGPGPGVAESRCRSPHPDEIYSLRLDLGLTQADCAAMVCYTSRAWQYCETGERRMHPAAWELFRLKTMNHPRPMGAATA